MRPLRVAIVNDYELVVQGLAAILAPFADRVEVVDLEAGGVPGEPADIALFDTFAGRRSAMSRVDAMADDPAFSKIVLYTWDLPDGFASDIGERAVDAVILKSTEGEQLVEALERIHRGQSVAPGEHDRLPGVPTLSEREREVLAPVKTHVRKVFTKLGVGNRTQAALIANEHGLAARVQRSAPGIRRVDPAESSGGST